MVTDVKENELSGHDRKVNTQIKVGKDKQNRLPHERDESPDCHTSLNSVPHATGLRSIITQAASDLEQGLVDTDLHGQRGIEEISTAQPKSAKPQSEVHNTAVPQTRS